LKFVHRKDVEVLTKSGVTVVPKHSGVRQLVDRDAPAALPARSHDPHSRSKSPVLVVTAKKRAASSKKSRDFNPSPALSSAPEPLLLDLSPPPTGKIPELPMIHDDVTGKLQQTVPSQRVARIDLSAFHALMDSAMADIANIGTLLRSKSSRAA
jgi:hypothetical protein